MTRNQRRILAETIDDADLELFEGDYDTGTWIDRRILIKQVGWGHEAIVPTLERAARGADTPTRLAIEGALARIGHPSAEAALQRLLEDEHALSSAAPSAIPDEPYWHRLVEGPRRIPFAFTVSTLGGEKGVSLLFLWVLFTPTLFAPPDSFAQLILIVPILGTVITYVLNARKRKTLRSGTHAYAKLESYKVVPQVEVSHLHCTIRYIDDLAREYVSELVLHSSLRDADADVLRPLLFNEDGSLMLLEEVHLTVSEDGQLVSKGLLNYIGILGPLIFIAALAVRFSWFTG